MKIFALDKLHRPKPLKDYVGLHTLGWRFLINEVLIQNRMEIQNC